MAEYKPTDGGMMNAIASRDSSALELNGGTSRHSGRIAVREEYQLAISGRREP
jgi:hypothetical protein